MLLTDAPSMLVDCVTVVETDRDALERGRRKGTALAVALWLVRKEEVESSASEAAGKDRAVGSEVAMVRCSPSWRWCWMFAASMIIACARCCVSATAVACLVYAEYASQVHLRIVLSSKQLPEVINSDSVCSFARCEKTMFGSHEWKQKEDGTFKSWAIDIASVTSKLANDDPGRSSSWIITCELATFGLDCIHLSRGARCKPIASGIL